MTARGTKPTPSALRVLEGGGQAAGLRGVQVEANLPDPPKWLRKEGVAEWRRLGPRLVALGLLSDFDRATFAAYCQAWGTVEALETLAAAMRKKEKDELAGIVAKTAAGNVIHHPLASTIAKARAEMLRIATEFGLTPSARARIDTDAAKNRGGGGKKTTGTSRFFD